MSVWYLDLDDEITDAVARLRVAQDDRVVLVLPPGSRIGTGRINFRLLAREAETRGVRLVMVSSDVSVRALAGSADLEAHASVPDAERALGLEVEAPASGGARSATTLSAGAPAAGQGTPPSPELAPAAVAAGDGSRLGSLLHRGRPASRYAVTPRTATAAAAAGAVGVDAGHAREGARIVRRGPSAGRRVASWGVRGAVLGALAAGGMSVAYLTLPTATVTLIPGTTQLPPSALLIVASPSSQGIDPEAGTIPAEWRPFPLSETGTFQATGTDDVTTVAEGTVRFTSQNTVAPVVIREGTIVRTNAGKEYRTTEHVRLPQWDGNGPKPSVEAGVRAVKRGPDGDTGKETITTVPPTYERAQVRVANPEPITGGTRQLVSRVRQADCEGARETLRAALTGKLAVELARPPMPGMTRYHGSASLGEPRFSRACGELVGSKVETFELTAETTATVLEVDTSVLADAAARTFQLHQAPGVQIEPDSVVATLAGDPQVTTDQVGYPMEVAARVTLPIDALTIRREIAGKPVEDAKRLLSRYGEATLTMWPDFVPTIPTDVARISLSTRT